ncbi:SMI1/KNR4 family protein [Pseudomonas purpurea]|uniref:SMI1/KNR4 family protein n=1 Tax=Pseudomonas purpurea TaxID=3136737 RepID=UPI0032639AC0
MIPERLVRLIEKQTGDIHTVDKASVTEALNRLDIPVNSEFAAFFLRYQVTFYESNSSYIELSNLGGPSHEIEMATGFIHEVWELPENFICLTGVQGEGCYVYDKHSGEVVDFDLAQRDAFLAGETALRWKSFFAFLTWYLS